MTDQSRHHYDDHALDQLIVQALGLEDTLVSNASDDALRGEFELAAALLDVSVADAAPVDMPGDLADRIKSNVDRYESQQDVQPDSFPFQLPQAQPKATTSWVPWMVAAASILFGAFAFLMPQRTPPAPVQDINAARIALIESTPADQLIQWDWISTDDSAVVGEVIGDVIWSDTLNKGYMRISGLAINDPSLEQYQLWIFDATRPTGDLPQFGEGLLTQRPVDGGVFDIPTTGEVIIEIDSKLVVNQAAAFAITVEPPGGVVVSDRSRVPLLALAP